MVIKTQNEVTKEDQYWEVFIPNLDLRGAYQILSQYGERIDLWASKRELERIDNCHLSELRFVPLKGDCEEAKDRTFYRGYEDENPFIIRKKALPELSVNMYIFRGVMSVDYNASPYQTFLNPSTKKELHKWFDKGLLDLDINSLLEHVKQESKLRLVDYAKKDVKKLRKMLDEISELTLEKIEKGR